MMMHSLFKIYLTLKAPITTAAELEELCFLI